MPKERSVENLRKYLFELVEGVTGLHPLEGEEALTLARVKALTDWQVCEWTHHFVNTDPDALHLYESRLGRLEEPEEVEFPRPTYNPTTGFFSNYDPWMP